jgi:hypothetical protein
MHHCSQLSVMVIDQQDSNHNGCQRPFLSFFPQNLSAQNKEVLTHKKREKTFKSSKPANILALTLKHPISQKWFFGYLKLT